MKCIVKDCENHGHQGRFIGQLCAPCYYYVSGKGGLHSQAYRNTRTLIDLAYKMEREACAKIAEDQAQDEPYGHAKFRCMNIADAIRARGQE